MLLISRLFISRQGACSVPRTLHVAASAVAALGLLVTGLLAMPASAASTGKASAPAHRTVAAHLPLSARQMLTDLRQHDRSKAPAGALTGAAVSPDGQTLDGVCVLAYGPSGRTFAVTRPDGQFLMTGLKPGTYELRYFGCGSTAAYLPVWYGGAADRSQSRSVVVTSSKLRPLAAVTMTTLGERSLVANVINPATPQTAAQSIAASLGLPTYGKGIRTAVVSAKGGRIAGVVTDPAGHGLKGICVEADATNSFAYSVATTNKSGHYQTVGMPSGSYDVVFYADCGNTGNWLVQVYKDLSTAKHPTNVYVSSGKVTAHINAKLQLGGEMSGVVTGRSGRRLSGICVYPLQVRQPESLLLAAVSARGSYHLRGLPHGAFKVEFTPCEPFPATPYAPIWWPHAETFGAARAIQLKARQVISGINEAQPVGAVVSGTITNTSDKPLKGVCVDAFPLSRYTPLLTLPFATTNGAGHYSLIGLSRGTYQIQASLGCGNTGNYIPANYARLLTVTYGQRLAGIDVELPTGATVSGVVTAAATGQPLGGLCVLIYPGGSAAFFSQAVPTKADGTYSVDQIPPGTYYAQFYGGCGNKGSYAPQGYDNTSVFDPQPFTVAEPAETITGIDAAMQPGATLSGTVTTSGGRRLTGMCVFAASTGGEVGFEANSFDGRYWMPNLIPGNYEVVAFPGCPSNANYVPEAFRQQASLPFVSVPVGVTSHISIVLAAGGNITGAVYTKSGQPVEDACFGLTGLNRATQQSLGGNLSGYNQRYTISELTPGPYQVIFGDCNGDNYETQWYKDKPSPAGATTVEVRAGQTASNINGAMVQGGSIAGTVTSSGRPVGNACVFAQNVNQYYDFGDAFSGPTGKYLITGLNSGSYELEFFPCQEGAANLAEGLLTRLVQVTAPDTTHGANFSLTPGGRIAGTVLSGSPAAVAPGVCVDALQLDGYGAGQAGTTSDGQFVIGNLPVGKYVVYIGDPTCAAIPDNLAPQWYLDSVTSAKATVVTVGKNATTHLASATLSSEGSISGTVTGPGGSPVAGICVTATSGAAPAPVVAVTNATGQYTVVGLAPGRYSVEFSSGCGASGFRTQWWKGRGSAAKATPITVSPASTITGVNATLQK
jgi:Carboxypeptidase regulatory-like domain